MCVCARALCRLILHSVLYVYSICAQHLLCYSKDGSSTDVITVINLTWHRSDYEFWIPRLNSRAVKQLVLSKIVICGWAGGCSRSLAPDSLAERLISSVQRVSAFRKWKALECCCGLIAASVAKLLANYSAWPFKILYGSSFSNTSKRHWTGTRILCHNSSRLNRVLSLFSKHSAHYVAQHSE